MTIQKLTDDYLIFLSKGTPFIFGARDAAWYKIILLLLVRPSHSVQLRCVKGSLVLVPSSLVTTYSCAQRMSLCVALSCFSKPPPLIAHKNRAALPGTGTAFIYSNILMDVTLFVHPLKYLMAFLL